MSATAPHKPKVSREVAAPDYTGAATPDYYEDDERGYGWVAFAGTLLLLVGSVNVIEGIAAIGNSSFFVRNTHYVFANLNTWGWIALILGFMPVARRPWRVRQEPVLTLGRRGRAGCQHDRAVVDDAGVSVLVADADRDGHPGDLRVDRVRQANRSS